jgi:hypothetical protein
MAWYSSLRHWSSVNSLVDTLHCDHMEGSLFWRTPYLGGVLCILEESNRPYIVWNSLDTCLEAWSWLGDAQVVAYDSVLAGGN